MCWTNLLIMPNNGLHDWVTQYRQLRPRGSTVAALISSITTVIKGGEHDLLLQLSCCTAVARTHAQLIAARAHDHDARPPCRDHCAHHGQTYGLDAAGAQAPWWPCWHRCWNRGLRRHGPVRSQASNCAPCCFVKPAFELLRARSNWQDRCQRRLHRARARPRV